LTLKKLSSLYRLNREIEQDKRRLIELKSAATSPGSQITGLPHASGISDKTGNYAVLIGMMSDEIEKKNNRTLVLYKELTEYINSIDDSYLRQIFMLRCVDGLPWLQVAASIGSSEYSVKHMFYRYIEKLAHMAH